MDLNPDALTATEREFLELKKEKLAEIWSTRMDTLENWAAEAADELVLYSIAVFATFIVIFVTCLGLAIFIRN